MPPGNYSAFAHIDFRHDSGSNTGSDLDPQKVQDPFTIANAKVGVGTITDGWDLEFWIRNFTDTTYSQVILDAPLQEASWLTFLAEPRTYGVTLRAKF